MLQKSMRPVRLSFSSSFYSSSFLLLLLLVVEASTTGNTRGGNEGRLPPYCNAERLEASTYSMPTSSDARLLHLQVITRHGARTPVFLTSHEDVEWDCRDETPSPCSGRLRQVIDIPDGALSTKYLKGSCEVGQLLPRGAEQLRRIGKSLREIYVERLNFLPRLYTDREVYVRSTSMQRAIDSASHLLSALFPPTNGCDTASPFTVRVRPVQIDTMIRNVDCPALDTLEKEVYATAMWQNSLLESNATVNHFKNIVGDPNRDEWKYGAMFAYDVVVSRLCEGKPLPCNYNGTSCMSLEDFDVLNRLVDFQYAYLYLTSKEGRDVSRFNLVPFIYDLRDDLLQAAANSSLSYPLLSLYSAHDTTVWAVLAALGAENVSRPPLASSLVIELWSAENEKFVRVFYNGKSFEVRDGTVLDFVPLDKFVELYDSNVVEDYTEACHESVIVGKAVETAGLGPIAYALWS